MRLALVTASILLSTTALAADKAKLVSVLPFDTTRTRMDDANKTALEESIRTEAGDILGDYGLTVLTSDTQLKILTDNGIDPNKACEAACHLEAARELNARYFISGIVTSEGEDLVGFIRLFDSSTGRQLASAELEGRTVRELRKSFAAKSKAFFARAGFGTTPPPAPPAPVGMTPPEVQRTPEGEDIAQRSTAAHRDLSRQEQRVPPAVEPPAQPTPPPPSPGTLSLAPEQQLKQPTPTPVPVPAPPRNWSRWFLGLSLVSAISIGGEWGEDNWSFRFGWIVIAARWYQDPWKNGLYVQLGLPLGIGYQWRINRGSTVSIGIPDLVEIAF